MTKTVYLIRHGEVEEKYKKRFRGTLDCELSPYGRQMSEANARFLIEQKIDKVITTGKKRADYVGKLVAARGIPHEIDIRFTEANFGLWEGKSWAEVEKEFPEEVRAYQQNFPSLRFPEGESITEVRNRVLEAWTEIIQLKFRKIAIVGHSTCNTCLMAHLQGKGFREIALQVIGSVHELEVAGEEIRIKRENVVLYPPAP